MKRLANLNWTPSWASIVGCLHGCLKYLDIDPGYSWLYGGTGHAFIINMLKDGSCPSGPTAWITSRFFELGNNLGYEIEGVFADKRQPGFEENQTEAWEFVKNAIDKDIPVIGWELAVPEFYVVNGYDEIGYCYDGAGVEDNPGPKPWRELGDSGIGMLEVLSVKQTQSVDVQTTIKEALEFAIAFNAGSTEWVLPEYRAGLDAFQVWIDAVNSGRAMLMGHAYNAAVWEESRRNGVDFLREAKNRLEGQLEKPLNAAILAYSEVAKQLKDITELYPFFENNQEEPLGENPRSNKAAEHLLAAKTAEEEGSGLLKEIVEGLV